MDEILVVTVGSGDRRFHLAYASHTGCASGTNNPTNGIAAHAGISDDSSVQMLTADFKLRLDQNHHVAGIFSQIAQDRQQRRQ